MTAPPDDCVIDLCGWEVEEVKKGQDEEEWIGQVKRWLKGQTVEFPTSLKVPREQFFLEDDVL